MKKDIQTKEDIGYLVDVFYDRVLKDEKIAHFFAHLNFEKHKPKMVQFWSFVLLDEPGYTTNVFDKHANLHANSADFNEWVSLFHATVNELFEGENIVTDPKNSDHGLSRIAEVRELPAELASKL